MKKLAPSIGRDSKTGKLTSSRGEKISAVEGMHLTVRMKTVLNESRGKSGDERRALVKAQFETKKR